MESERCERAKEEEPREWEKREVGGGGGQSGGK